MRRRSWFWRWVFRPVGVLLTGIAVLAVALVVAAVILAGLVWVLLQYFD